MEDIYAKKSALKRKLAEIIESEKLDNPMCLFFKESFITPKYKITIEIVEEDFIIDEQGRKWIRYEE